MTIPPAVAARPPTRRELLAIAAVAVALRVGVFLAATLGGGMTVARVTAQADTPSYVAYAAALAGERPLASLDEYDRRVFPGYPAMVAVVHMATRLPLPVSALVTTWLMAGVAAAAAAGAFGDVRVGWAMTCLVPHYLLNSTLGMGEAPLLAAVTVGAWAARQRSGVGEALLGGGALVRPMACFATAGVAWADWRGRRRAAAVRTAMVAALVFGVGFVAMQAWTGDALAGVRIYATHPGAYNGHLLGWPFQSLLQTPTREPTTASRLAYVWTHVAVVLAACVLVTRRQFARDRDGRDDLAFPWLVGNTLFVLCIGSAWGFRHFPRFTIPAAPPLFWAVRRWLPRRPGVWVAIGLACAAGAVAGIVVPVQ